MEKEVLLLSEYRRKRILWNRIYKVSPVISTLLLVGLWVLASSNPASKFPSPAEVWGCYIKFLSKSIRGLGLMGHIWISFRRVFTAPGLSWALDISFNTLTGWNKRANATLGPIPTASRAVPPLAWIPLATMWFGIGEFPKALIVFISALMPVAINTHTGISNVEKEYLDIETISNTNSRQMLFKIAIPSILDTISAGIRNSTSAGRMVVLATEMLGGGSGIGFLIVRGMDPGNYSLCLLATICIGIMGYMLAILTQLSERAVCPWAVRRPV